MHYDITHARAIVRRMETRLGQKFILNVNENNTCGFLYYARCCAGPPTAVAAVKVGPIFFTVWGGAFHSTSRHTLFIWVMYKEVVGLEDLRGQSGTSRLIYRQRKTMGIIGQLGEK